MTVSLAFFTFLNAWWISLFLVLPFMPEADGWKKKILAATVLAVLLTAALALLIKSGIVPLRNTLP